MNLCLVTKSVEDMETLEAVETLSLLPHPIQYGVDDSQRQTILDCHVFGGHVDCLVHELLEGTEGQDRLQSSPIPSYRNSGTSYHSVQRTPQTLVGARKFFQVPCVSGPPLSALRRAPDGTETVHVQQRRRRAAATFDGTPQRQGETVASVLSP